MCQSEEQLSQVVTANDTVINSPESLCVPCFVPPATVSLSLTDPENSLQWSKLTSSSIIYSSRRAERASGLSSIRGTEIRTVPCWRARERQSSIFHILFTGRIWKTCQEMTGPIAYRKMYLCIFMWYMCVVIMCHANIARRMLICFMTDVTIYILENVDRKRPKKVGHEALEVMISLLFVNIFTFYFSCFVLVFVDFVIAT